MRWEGKCVSGKRLGGLQKYNLPKQDSVIVIRKSYNCEFLGWIFARIGSSASKYVNMSGGMAQSFNINTVQLLLMNL